MYEIKIDFDHAKLGMSYHAGEKHSLHDWKKSEIKTAIKNGFIVKTTDADNVDIDTGVMFKEDSDV